MLPAHTGFSPTVVASAMFKRNPCELPKIIISPSHISRNTNTSTPDLAHHFPHNIRQTQWPCGPPPPANGRSCRGKRGLGRSCKARIAPVQSLEGGFLVCTRNRKAHAVAWQTGHELQRPNRKAGNQPPSIAYLADGLTSFSLSFTGDHSQQPCSCTSTRHNTILHQPACLRLPPSSRRPPIRLEAALALPRAHSGPVTKLEPRSRRPGQPPRTPVSGAAARATQPDRPRPAQLPAASARSGNPQLHVARDRKPHAG